MGTRIQKAAGPNAKRKRNRQTNGHENNTTVVAVPQPAQVPSSPNDPATNGPTVSLPNRRLPAAGQSNTLRQLPNRQLQARRRLPPSRRRTNIPITSLLNNRLPGQPNTPGQQQLATPFSLIPPIPRIPSPEPRLPLEPHPRHATANQAEQELQNSERNILEYHIQMLEYMIRQANQREIELRNSLYIQHALVLERRRVRRDTNNVNNRGNNGTS